MRNRNLLWETIFLLFLIFSGCAGRGGTFIESVKFALEYSVPPMNFKEMIDASVKVERFSASTEYMTTVMLIKPSEYVRSSYRRGRWHVPPADLVTSLFLRDLRFSGLFKRVYSPDDIFAVDYNVDGRIEEFLQVDTPEGSYASLIILMTVTKRDTQHQGVNVVFQKTYRAIEPLKEKNPRGLAEGMSHATMRVSLSFMEDLRERLSP
ncbi:MAG: ABC-type transport auxiliary lipoprotein family protein [Syntrophales bacterium]|nr:ABC-type transport auxiliary lipoprotein family protein [Syntrophales bacterium]